MLGRLSLAIVCLLSAAAGAPFTNLYFFGDSLTDTGNIYNVTSLLNTYTLGLFPVHPSEPYFAGRFTNGPVWAEHTAARLGQLEDSQPAGMSLGVFGQTGGPGNNYAVGGARTDTGGALGFLDFLLPTGIATQVDYYLGRTGGVADPNALYFILGAGNDLRDASRIDDPQQRQEAAVQAGVNIAYSVRDLYLAGARQFVLSNSPDIGLIPETISAGRTVQGTDASSQFNQWLAAYGSYLDSQVPDFSLTYFDLFSVHRLLVDIYGIDAVRPCEAAPQTCQETLFFDSIHPNAWVHAIVGELVANQILGSGMVTTSFASVAEVQNPEPSTALLTLSAGIAVIIIRRRRA